MVTFWAWLTLAAAVAAGEVVPVKLEAFDLQNVRLLDGPCKTAQEANRRYLHQLDEDRLLWTFRQNAGLPTPGEPLGGWEAPSVEVRGHFLGHYLSACALMYASTGDEELRAKAARIIAELARCQQALGGGYLSAFPESFWDRLEAMQNPPWAPYYVIHKIMAGLFDNYVLCANSQALDVLKGMADYFARRLRRLSTFEIDRMLAVEFGGMSEVLHNLYSVTGRPEDLWLAHCFDRAAFLGPLALDHDNLTNIHANTHIPQIAGAARRYEVTGDERYRHIVEFFFDRVANHRSYATGGSNLNEHWGEPDRLAATIGASNQESCTTYNILKVARYLIRWTGDAKYGDFYERAFFNGILGTQNPETGMLIYFLPLAPAHTKSFGTPYDSFWCCYGTGIESFSKLGDSIYFHDERGLFVNLFIASALTWPEKGLRVEQLTDFPEQEGTSLVFHVATPIRLALNVRVPYWATRGVEVKINRKLVRVVARPTSYLTIERQWRDGDRVDVRMPMSLHAHPMPDDPELVATMYGPLVLAGLVDRKKYFLGDPARPETWLRPVEGRPLTFETVGQAEKTVFIPLYRVISERYGVYFVVTPEGSPRHKQILDEEEARRRREARVIDRVRPNDPESEAAHNLQGVNHGAGDLGGQGGWRHAPDGWFSWDLKVLPDVPITLVCTFWGSDSGARTFDILVDGQTIGTVTLNNNKPGELFDIEYELPQDLTRGKERITVRFQAHPGNIAGGCFGCATLRSEAVRP